MNSLADFREIETPQRSLAELTTWRIGGVARRFFAPTTAGECARLVLALESGRFRFRVLGGGADVLIDDGEHEIIVVHPARLDAVEWQRDGVIAGAGVPFQRLVTQSTIRGLAGLEVLAGIPGQLGGICAMNAGGRYGEIKDVIDWIEVADRDGVVRRIDATEAALAYRSSALPRRGVVTAARLRLRPSDDAASLRRRASEILKAKAASQPLQEASGGCVFANPEGSSAGRLVEDLGLKGLRHGRARVSEKHANFIINEGGASFLDVLTLIRRIETEALERRGVVLRREVRIWMRTED